MAGSLYGSGSSFFAYFVAKNDYHHNIYWKKEVKRVQSVRRRG